MLGLVFFELYFTVEANEPRTEMEVVEGNLKSSANCFASSYLILLKFLGRLPFLPTFRVISLFLIVKLLEPMLAKLLLMDCLMDSMAVSIPTSAIIPIAMINTVKTDLKRWLLTDCRDIRIFSFNMLIQTAV